MTLPDLSASPFFLNDESKEYKGSRGGRSRRRHCWDKHGLSRGADQIVQRPFFTTSKSSSRLATLLSLRDRLAQPPHIECVASSSLLRAVGRAGRFC